MDKKNIVILTADAGFGHRSAANAVGDAVSEKYAEQCRVSIINPYDDKRTPTFLRESQFDYDKIVRDSPSLYKIGYEASDSPIPTAIAESMLTVLLFEVMQTILRDHKPDAILTTYPLYQAPLTAVYTITNQHTPLLTSVTDLANVHQIWFNNNANSLLVPTRQVYQQAVECGIEAEKIQITGIPVRPAFKKETRTKTEIRSALGWQTDIPTFLAVGSKRVEHLQEALNVLNHFGSPLQLIMVAGNDQVLFDDLHKIEWHVPVRIYNFVQDIATMMKAADVLVCKAGGLIVTEALASGLPMLLVDALPGQETGNANYVTQEKAGNLIKTPAETLETVFHWLMNEQNMLKSHAENAKKLGKPLAAYDAADLLWKAAQQGPSKRTLKLFPERPHLIDLLSRHNVSWKDHFSLSGKKNKPDS